MAKHPLTGELYAVLKVSGGPAPPGAGRGTPGKTKKNKPGSGAGSGPGPVTGRILVTLCPMTGDATFLYDPGDAFAG